MIGMKARPKAVQRAVARTLRAARLAARLTQRELAARLEWPPERVTRVEGARRSVRATEFGEIARALGRDPRLLGKALDGQRRANTVSLTSRA
jgi:transcriptional regulator with XRE-family HTH domain